MDCPCATGEIRRKCQISGGKGGQRRCLTTQLEGSNTNVVTLDDIVRERAAIKRKYGPWTAYNITLAPGVETAPEFACAHLRLRRVVQTVADLSGKSWKKLRIIDLGSLEGIFALEFAAQGAQVVGIEGREANNARARFSAEALGLSNVSFATDDVRNLSLEKYGRFDVVLCSGILYHLPGEDGCRLLRSISEVCERLAIIDTHVGLHASRSFLWEGRTYRGLTYSEHSPQDSTDAKAVRAWASLDNNESFWFTKPSLLNLLRDVGFTSVSEVVRPLSFNDFADRFTFAALKGQPQRIVMSPELEQTQEADYAEESHLQPHPSQRASPPRPLWRRIGSRVRRTLGV
jgi:Methyltransferase domain